MTAKQFAAAIKRLDVSRNRAGALLGVGTSSVHNYLTGRQTVPLYLERLIELLLKHGVPKEWRA